MNFFKTYRSHLRVLLGASLWGLISIAAFFCVDIFFEQNTVNLTPDLLCAADLYVTARKREGLPFNVVEALGAKKTVIASRVKGHVDVIEDGKSGFLYSPECEEELVSLVCKAHSHEISLSEDDILTRYSYYSKAEVFSETLEVIRRTLGLSEGV